MAKCGICGEPVTSGVVHHPSCWEQKVEKAMEEFCDHYCKWPGACNEEDWEDYLREQVCEKSCPVNKLLEMKRSD